MQIIFYNNISDTREVPKTLTNQITKTGTLRDSGNIQNPVITTAYNPIDKNYCYISDFNRYYYIDSVTAVRNNLFEISCRCDVLESFKDDILNSPAIISRNSSNFNTFLADESRKFYQYAFNQYITIGDVGAPNSPILVTIG